MPKGCIFADKGPAAFTSNDSPDELLALLAIMNSSAFVALVTLQLARTELAQSFEVGLIQQTPIPDLSTAIVNGQVATLALQAFALMRERDHIRETTHVFHIPLFARYRLESLRVSVDSIRAEFNASQNRVREIQATINTIVTDLYSLSDEEINHLTAAIPESADGSDINIVEIDDVIDDLVGNEEEASTNDVVTEIQNLLMWCLGCAFGRWDLRFALDPTLLPKLQSPFDPLPRCSPGILLGPNSLPATPGNIVSEAWLRARPNVIALPDPSTLGASPATISDSAYSFRIDWDGIIPDDDGHPDDIVRRVQDVLELLWGDRAEAIEHEACQILGVASLRDYFRQPKAFFDFHIKRYSKSRRKAPIYWLLQSAKKNYGLWLYYHRLDSDTLFKALTLYADPKLNIERTRLEDLQRTLNPDLPARDRRALEKTIARQESVISELADFRAELERIARLGLAPDFNDGVIISIAPLHSLVPWKEAAKMWAELTSGKYSWSTMSQRMRQKGLAKGAGD